MAEYRNTDNVLIMFNRFYRMCKLEEQKSVVLAMKQAFLEIKPEDVVPRSEYDDLKMQFTELDIECDRLEKVEENYHKLEAELQKSKQEIAREIFDLIKLYKQKWASGEIVPYRFIAELEKEYIGKDTDAPTNIGE